jgi:hypothetical protein
LFISTLQLQKQHSTSAIVNGVTDKAVDLKTNSAISSKFFGLQTPSIYQFISAVAPAAATTEGAVDGATRSLKDSLMKVLNNLDIKRIVKSILTKATDIDTFVDLQESPKFRSGNSPTSADSDQDVLTHQMASEPGAETPTLVHRTVQIAFFLNEQHPELLRGAVILFIGWMLVLVFLLGTLQGWCTTW